MIKYNEKKAPSYKLDTIKSLIKERKYSITKTATDNAMCDFGLTPKEILCCILKMENSNFYKSMTSEYDNHTWQDVYHVRIEKELAYIKLQILEDKSVIISFKRK